MSDSGAIDPTLYRRTLGTYPTGVVIVSADAEDGPVGLAIGSFTSVSLDPPLVGFLPGKGSTTWPKIETTGAFCVNILAADQLSVCKAFSSKDGDRYASTPWRTEVSGAPVIEGVLSWIDCSIEAVEDAGDHWWVTGRVLALANARDDVGPLQFFRGAYGDFSPLPSS
ncbi:MAG: flavin reductase family protein [Acidimicrobiia bacterium]|nr:flavin reductase family protein [Acidimicrobiia bacterium]